MTANSDWQELVNLTIKERSSMLDKLADKIQEEIIILRSVFLCDLDTIAVVQQHLDRIKALIMSRGKNDSK